MKALFLAAAALTATAGFANAQFEGTFGSAGNFGFNGTTGFSNCTSGGQGEAGTGSTDCTSGTTGNYSFHANESIHGGFQEFNQFESQSQTSNTSGVFSSWQKSMDADGVQKIGQNSVGNLNATNTLTNSTGGFQIDGNIDRNTTINFEGSGFTFTNSNFSAGMMGGMGNMGCTGHCND